MLRLSLRALRAAFRREPPHLRLGRWGERCAEHSLRAQGYHIIHRRVRLGRREEIDLVARHEKMLVFIEVKTRSSEGLGRPLQSVDRRKRRTLGRAARRYLARLRRKPEAFRFDVIEVIGTPGGPAPVIRHIEGAIRADPRGSLRW